MFVMRSLGLTVFFILGLSFAIKADSWALPTTAKYCSSNGKYCLKVEPKLLEGQLDYFKDKVASKDNAGAKKLAKENYCKGTFTAKGKKLWKVQLDNQVSPVSALISDDGKYVVTFDNWHSVGYGDNAVVIYNGLTGKLIKKLALADFLTESDITGLSHSVSSIWWGDKHQIDYETKQLILKVVHGRKDGEVFDVRIDLENGAVLDKVIDRIPSLQFTLTTTDDDFGSLDYPIPDLEVSCAALDSIRNLSSADLHNRIVKRTMPEYPSAAKAVRAIGRSSFDVVISENGSIECLRQVSGHPLLRSVLNNAIKIWEFEKSQTKYRGKIIIEGKYSLILNGKIIK